MRLRSLVCSGGSNSRSECRSIASKGLEMGFSAPASRDPRELSNVQDLPAETLVAQQRGDVDAEGEEAPEAIIFPEDDGRGGAGISSVGGVGVVEEGGVAGIEAEASARGVEEHRPR